MDSNKEELERLRAEWEYSLDGNPDGNTDNTGYPSMADTITLNSNNTTTVANGGYTINLSGLNYTNTGAYTIGTAANNPWATTTQAGRMELIGDDADLIINGVSLKSILEERLNVLVPNPELEREWDQLKVLGDEYRRLETELKEKAKMWSALKK